MSIVLKREQIASLNPKYNLAPTAKQKVEPSAPDPVAAAIDRFSAAITEVTQVNAASSIAITELLKQLSAEIKAASPPRPRSWTFHAKKDKAGNMTINATPNY